MIDELVPFVTPPVVESAAVKVQPPDTLNATLENIATPDEALTLVVPVAVHVELITTVSVAPVPEVITFPLASSTLTENDVRFVPAVPVEGGSVVKINLLRYRVSAPWSVKTSHSLVRSRPP